MNHTIHLLLASLSLLPVLTAQTQVLRGKVEDVRNTQNQFYLDGTRIPVVSTAVVLNTIVGQQSLLQVVDVGTAGAPVLRVESAVPAAPNFDMGNLRLGQSARWSALAPAGSFAFLFLNWTDSTAYTPFGGFGVWLLGNGAATLASGVTNAQNQFEIRYTMPVIPSLVGLEMTGQALIDDHGTWFLSNVDSKEIETQ
jgi:hypothetical protein